VRVEQWTTPDVDVALDGCGLGFVVVKSPAAVRKARPESQGPESDELQDRVVSVEDHGGDHQVAGSAEPIGVEI
jgi:hypothetical protein